MHNIRIFFIEVKNLHYRKNDSLKRVLFCMLL